MKDNSTFVEKIRKLKNVLIIREICNFLKDLIKVDFFYGELDKLINFYASGTSSIRFIKENSIYNFMFENKSNNKSLSIQINLKNYSKNKDVFQIVCRSSEGTTTSTNRYISNSDGIYISENVIDKSVRKYDDFSYYSTRVDDNFYEFKSDGYEFHKKLEFSNESYRINNLTGEKSKYDSDFEGRHEFWRNDDGLVFSRRIIKHLDGNDDTDYIYTYPYCRDYKSRKGLNRDGMCFGYAFNKELFDGVELDIQSIDEIYSRAEDILLKNEKNALEEAKRK